MYAYSETTFGRPTIGYVMTENGTLSVAVFEKMSVIVIWNTQSTDRKKRVHIIRFVNHNKTLLE